MKKIFVIMGKSSSGKDTIFKELLKSRYELNIAPYIPYTTRPIREGEKHGVDYFFVSDDEFNNLISNNKMLEHREYNTIHGIWKYGTVSDKQFETDNNIIIILTLEGYLNFISSNIINKENIVPIYIDLDDGKRLSRALSRERNQKEPKYEELCRRFLADSKDFSEDKLQAAGINTRFENDIFLKCVKEIKNYIISFN